MTAGRLASTIVWICLSALVIAPLTAWAAMALWFRLPAPEWARAAAAGVFVIIALATLWALFTRSRVRRERNSQFSPIADAFKSHTLIYLATTERDSVRLRSNVRGEDVRLYRLNTPPEQARVLLTQYVLEATALAKRPKFYNSITANCATVVFKIMRAAGGMFPFDWRLVVNGFLPGYLYDHRVVVTTMPLSELMERARINAQVKAADQSPEFSRLIRVDVPSPFGQAVQ